MKKFTQVAELVPCYYHDIAETFDIENLTLSYYASERISGVRYPTTAVTADGHTRACTCLKNPWILFGRIFDVSFNTPEFPDQPYLKDPNVDSLVDLHKTRGKWDFATTTKFFAFRLFGALEIEFYNQQIINESDNMHHADATTRKMTGIHLGMSVKTWSEEIAQVTNAIGMVSKICSVSYQHTNKPSLAIVIMKVSDNGEQTSLTRTQIKDVLNFLFPLMKMVMNGAGVYDFCFTVI